MRIVRRWLLAGALIVSTLPQAAWAGEVDILLNKLVEHGILTASQAQDIRNEVNQEQVKQDKALDEKLAKAGPEWAQRTSWKGDFRLRNEYRDRSGTGNNTNRQRIRFRDGFTSKVSDELKVGARLATGSLTDPISTNDSFDDTFTKKGFNLDRAYLEYAPEMPGVSETKLIGGIIENPFWTPSPMVWDDDLSFDGAAAHVAQDIGPVKVFANSGVFSLDTDETETASLWSVQGGVSATPLDGVTLTGALAYHDYKNVINHAKAGTDIVANLGTNSTNLSILPDVNLLNLNLELATKVAGVPASLSGDWVHNTSAEDEENGYNIGLKLGKAKKPIFSFTEGLNLKDGLEAGYFWQRLEANAQFDEFVDSDFGGGGTNHKGNVWYVKLGALKNSTIGIKWFDTEEVTGAKNHFDTVQMDWVTSF